MDQHFTETANQNAPISFFAQLMKYLPHRWLLDEDLKRNPRSNARKFTVWDQMVSLLFCHLAGCDSLREIEDGLVSAVGKLMNGPPGRTASFSFRSWQKTSLLIFSSFSVCVVRNRFRDR